MPLQRTGNSFLRPKTQSYCLKVEMLKDTGQQFYVYPQGNFGVFFVSPLPGKLNYGEKYRALACAKKITEQDQFKATQKVHDMMHEPTGRKMNSALLFVDSKVQEYFQKSMKVAAVAHLSCKEYMALSCYEAKDFNFRNAINYQLTCNSFSSGWKELIAQHRSGLKKLWQFQTQFSPKLYHTFHVKPKELGELPKENEFFQIQPPMRGFVKNFPKAFVRHVIDAKGAVNISLYAREQSVVYARYGHCEMQFFHAPAAQMALLNEMDPWKEPVFKNPGENSYVVPDKEIFKVHFRAPTQYHVHENDGLLFLQPYDRIIAGSVRFPEEGSDKRLRQALALETKDAPSKKNSPWVEALAVKDLKKLKGT